MSEIEWQESYELQPENASLPAFCASLGLDWQKLEHQEGILAFIQQQALDALQDFLAHDLEREHGGVLAGRPYYDSSLQRYFVVIHAAIPAQETSGSSTHLQLTPAAWNFISGILEQDHPGLVIVGWYHSHPGLGVFMSGTDRDTQRAFFHHPWSLAVVVDPVTHQAGWFSGPECLALNRQQVFACATPAQALAAAVDYSLEEAQFSQLESEYYASQAVRNWRWLLPAASLILSLLFSAWWLGRGRG